MASGWNLWEWLECIGGGVSGWCCKEVYRFLHNITYPYSTCFTSFLNSIPTSLFINPRRACAARVTVVVSCVCVCLSVCMSVCPHKLFW